LKKRLVFECSSCGAKYSKWTGRCSNCGAWNSLIEVVEETSKNKIVQNNTISNIYKLSEIDNEPEFRIKTKINELDRVLGGGIIPGSLVLVGGDPGIGKSTLMLQMCGNLHKDSIYITGEESLKQIKYRSQRLKGINDISICSETEIEKIINTIKKSQSKVAVVDSIQSVFSDNIDATAGSISQIRESAMKLFNLAKQENIAIFLIGHVTKDGIIAGPKILEHTVDTVIQFEGDKNFSYRILRALKNRFGSTNEIGIFEMNNEGLSEVLNPSEVFLSNINKDENGIAIVSAIEGTRPILIEVQSLVSPSGYGMPQRISNGFDSRRLQMILAVIEKRLGFQLKTQDIFVNLAGGLYINDTSIDLGIAIAVISSYLEKSIPEKTLLIGEIGLTGEVRAVQSIPQRISEGEKLGIRKIILPNLKSQKFVLNSNVELFFADKISNVLNMLF
jgi:DNA repair protein RadA/Sms